MIQEGKRLADRLLRRVSLALGSNVALGKQDLRSSSFVNSQCLHWVEEQNSIALLRYSAYRLSINIISTKTAFLAIELKIKISIILAEEFQILETDAH